ncbi:hypothetical protein EWM64_g3101 [Hericium alpestre]|uniref:Uncharacterized protein n=1 Tax=Hericium alpestre TaxID=135208 RepID=A0A4Z0A1F6_9AGAM|nr:hypothetical protein EWM64_g3101 [Hericium alpestre]
MDGVQSPNARSYGESLPDQVDRVASLSDAHLDLFGDLLAKKAAEKKTKKMGTAVFGEDPAQIWSEESLTQRLFACCVCAETQLTLFSTLNNACAKIIGFLVNASQDHNNVADAINNQVVDPVKALERKAEDNIKKEKQFYQKLLSERDRVYNDRTKAKQKYDEECVEERAHDDRHADRVAKQCEQQVTDMLNAKNVYLLSTVVANKTKTRFYTEDLPRLEDQYQHLQVHLLTKFVNIIHHAQALFITHYDTLKSRVVIVDDALNDVDPGKDQELFMEYNIRPFTAISDWVFEPCASHYDTDEISLEPGPKVFLQNRLARSRAKRQEVEHLLADKSKEADKLLAIVTAYRSNQSLGNADEILENFLQASHQTTSYQMTKTCLDAEIEILESNLGGDEGGQNPHAFKSSSFTIPTECGYCRTSIWGLSKQGKTCKACGLSVHSKCELKVPADCTGNRASRHRQSESLSSVSRLSSISPSSLQTSTPSPSPLQSEIQAQPQEQYPIARVIFDFTPTSPFELAVEEGTVVHVIEEDDGSGWVKVSDNSGGKGLVPASYVQVTDASAPPSRAPVPMLQQALTERVRGLYDYQAQGPDELDVREGDIIELTDGGRNYAEGWWEGIDPRGKRGIFPSNYVEDV